MIIFCKISYLEKNQIIICFLSSFILLKYEEYNIKNN